MLELAVKDMTCGHCAAVITKAVKETDPAATCEIDLAARTVRIASAAAPAEFVASLARAGYVSVPAAPGA